MFILINETIKYYNANAEIFYHSTIEADMTELYARFDRYLSRCAKVLDFGCGSGRDSLYFIKKGYKVDAIDGSVSLCKKASTLIGKQVQCVDFNDFSATNIYAGIWACASLLHLKKSNLMVVLDKLYDALKENGILYISFKYGEFEGMRNGRYFIDLNEESLEKLVYSSKGFDIQECWLTGDVREGRGDERWINAILIKK